MATSFYSFTGATIEQDGVPTNDVERILRELYSDVVEIRDDTAIFRDQAAASEAEATTQAGLATTARSDAESAAATAEAERIAAQSARTEAETAETNAVASASAASTSETNAAASEAAAAASASAAATSETNAANSASAAATSETNAANSASAAATSETNAATSESNAASSASDAATSESNAATSESNAAASASAAATSESNAAASASAAATSESNAATSASDAAASAASVNASNFVSVSGDTMTGALTVPALIRPNGNDWGARLRNMEYQYEATYYTSSSGSSFAAGAAQFLYTPLHPDSEVFMQITSSTHARGVNGSGSDAGIDVALYQYDYPDTRWDKFDGFRRVRSFNAYDTLLVDAPVTFNYKDTPAFRRASDSLVNVRLYFNVIYTGSGARADMYDATATFFELSPL